MSLQQQPGGEGLATAQALRAKAATICQGELEKAFRQLARLSDAERQTVAGLATAVAAGVISSPMRRLRAGSADSYDAVLRELFGLDRETTPE